MMQIEFVFALPHIQHRRVLRVEKGSRVKEVLFSSLLDDLNLSPAGLACGVFGRLLDLESILQEGDRLEIYRPILLDPKLRRTQKVQQSTLPRRCR